MRIKKVAKLAALMLGIGAFSMPMTAYAGGDTTPPTLEAALEGGPLSITAEDDNSGVEAVYIEGMRVSSLVDGKASVEFKDYAGDREAVGIYAVDYAGNRSDTVTVENPFYEEPSFAAGLPGEDPDGEAQEEPGTAFTPDGTGTVLDEADGEKDHKQFYTITTEEGNVFYLVIDGEREEKNVYFLNAVTETDLMALAEKDGGSQVSAIPEACTCADRCEAGKVDVSCQMCRNDLTGCTGKEAPVETPEPEEPEKPEKGTGGLGSILFILIAMAAVCAGGYYVKIVRPKQQAQEEEDGFDDEGYGEGFDPDEAFGETEYLSEDDFEDRDGYGSGDSE